MNQKPGVYLDPNTIPSEVKSDASSVVLKIVASKKCWILKQILSKLDPQQEGILALDCIAREHDCLSYLSRILRTGSVPQTIHYDAENRISITTSTPEKSEKWADQLSKKIIEPDVAAKAGTLLGSIHHTSYGDEDLAFKLGDKKIFYELRLNPFYSKIAETHPHLADKIGSFATALATSNICFVHGAYSPENILIHHKQLWLVDFETGHFGHPAFDVAWMITHLTLETIRFWNRKNEYLLLITSFWSAYTHTAHFESQSWHERSFLPHLGCLLLATTREECAPSKGIHQKDH